MPDDPDPEPTPGEFAELVKLSQRLAERLKDADTAEALAAAIRSTADALDAQCERGQCPGAASVKSSMVAAIEQTLLMRRGPSQRVNWLDGWRRPINDALIAEQLTTVPRYVAAMRAVALGLASAR